ALNQFNILASDKISLNRSLPDARLDKCKKKSYPTFLPTTSIVIVFHNEAWSTLLRTVWSVINRSPRTLLKEIILVDDASERARVWSVINRSPRTLLKEIILVDDASERVVCPIIDVISDQTFEYITASDMTWGGFNWKLREKNRHKKTVVCPIIDVISDQTFEYITASDMTWGGFNWIEIQAICRKTVVCPIIDVISDQTFEYITASDMTWGGFNWKLNFRWYRVPPREMMRRGGDRSSPLRTPTMAGGLFAIDKDYFYELGSYDEGMDIWGGENLEMSFRVWQCGGILEIIPCSHVGHVFRDKSPYTFPGGVSKIVLHNAARVAEVWMDEWRDFYYAMNPGKSASVSTCAAHFRMLSYSSWFSGSILKVGMSYCHGLGGNQVFAYTKRHQIMSDDNCLDVPHPGGPVNLIRCHGMGGNQAWEYDLETKEIKHKNTDLCLEKPSAKEPSNPTLSACDGSKGQQWILKIGEKNIGQILRETFGFHRKSYVYYDGDR
ncbi:polypeptide N-acetylgalactosaminyltransferase 5-like, partial [Diaphorina citri]|uniref:Polypeptide N-acetylgalactosaminyltransferase n=1 Tax=Diaphorina citri TaxID=121845 RepID=A0A3Q0JFM1_DIACI